MSKIRQRVNSLNLILRSIKLFIHIARFKYFKYMKLQNNIKEFIFLNKKSGMIEFRNINNLIKKSYETFYVIFIDSKSNKTLKLLNEIKENLHIFCTYRTYSFLSNKVSSNLISQISMKNIYDLDLGKINKYILDTLYQKIYISNISKLSIITIGIDDKINLYDTNMNNNDQQEIPNNMNNLNPIGKFLVYVLSSFMSTYYLYEIGKNKQSQEKIESNIKFLKKQLLMSDLIIKKNKLANE